MKKYYVMFGSLILCFILFMPVFSTDGIVSIYAPDGREAQVLSGEAESYFLLGWYPEPVCTMYSTDGKTIVVTKREMKNYLSEGWYEKPVSIIYSVDGRQAVVYRTEIEAYLIVGWYSEPPIKLYASDGRECIVVESQRNAYVSLGWYENIDDVSKIMISPEGVEERIYSDFYSDKFSEGYIVKNERVIDPLKPMIALTYDDGPSIYTRRILECLQLNNSTATFFSVGNNVEIHPQITQMAYRAGMEIGNHSYSHPNFNAISVEEALKQISDASEKIAIATGGFFPELMRLPFGNINKELSSVMNMPDIHWSLDTLDWKSRNGWEIIKSVMDNVKDGDIILMHDVYKETADATEIIVPALVKQGFQLVTISELAQYRNCILTPGTRYYSFKVEA